MAELDPLDWIVGDDTGISSRAIWCRMMGRRAGRDAFGNHPHDPADFGRCHRLMLAVPAWRVRLGEMAAESAVWRRLVQYWDAIEREYIAEFEEQGLDHTTKPFSGSCPRTYHLMRKVIENRYDPSQVEMAPATPAGGEA